MPYTLLKYIGLFGWLWNTVICLALLLLVGYQLKVWRIRGRGRRLLAMELRLEAAWQNVTGVKGSGVLSRRPLTPGARELRPMGATGQESIQQTEISCDI